MRFFMMLVALIVTSTGSGCGKREETREGQGKGDPMKGVVFGEPKVAPEPAPAPAPADGNLQLKPNPKPKGVVQSVRGAVVRTERQSELRQIGLFFKLFVDERNGKNPTSDEEFINYIKREAGGIAQAFQEKYYILNLKVNMRDANAVIAYENLTDAHVVRVDGSVGAIPTEELQKLITPQ